MKSKLPSTLRFKPTAFATNILLALFIGVAIAMATGFNALVIAFAIFSLTTLPQLFAPFFSDISLRPNLFYAGIAQEVWETIITEHLFPDDSFVWQAQDDNKNLDGKIVHLPQIGGSPNVVVNRNVFPATPQPRVDSIISYEIDDHTTDPTYITLTEEQVLSYDKTASVIQDHLNVLKTSSHSAILSSWCIANPVSGVNMRLTTGSMRPAATTTQTGSRRACIVADISWLTSFFNSTDIPEDGRCLLLNPWLFNDLLQLEQFTNMFYIGATDAIKKGIIEEAIGFKIFVRSAMPSYSSTYSLNALGSAPQSGDNLAAIAWHPQMVRRAWGNLTNGGMEIFENPRRAEYYGSVFSALVRAGGSPARNDGRGIAMLVEANS